MDLTTFADDYWKGKDDRVDLSRLDLLIAAVPPGASVLVVDGGPGMLAARLRERGFGVRMTDISAHAVARASAKGLDAVQVDTDDAALPYSAGSFDCVISDSAIEHRYWPEKALAECARVVRPGGRVLLLVPNIAHWRHRLWLFLGRFPVVKDGPSDRSHLRHFGLPDLLRLASEAGLVPRRVQGFPSLWVKGLYPSLFRMPPVRTIYGLLTRLRPSLFARDLLLWLEPRRR